MKIKRIVSRIIAGLMSIALILEICNVGLVNAKADNGGLGSSYILGDVSGDGSINSKDAVIVKRLSAGYPYPNLEVMAADVNGDSVINAKDSVFVLRYSSGLITAFDDTGCLHTLIKASCKLPAICIKCSSTHGVSLPHDYSAATCTTLATCKACGTTTGTLESHIYVNGKCKACGKDDDSIALLEKQIYEKLISYKTIYPEGTYWTNESAVYVWRYHNVDGMIYSSYTGRGCAAFAFELSDAAFGESAPVHKSLDLNSVRVGDIIRLNWDTHSVIVLAVDGDTITIAEGNFNSSVHWGRNLSKKALLENNSFTYIYTRY